jgi:hypothetical protein
LAYAIIVREMSDSPTGRSFVLARAIHDRATAERIVNNLTTSYPKHGFDQSRGVHWFHGLSGLHEIWAATET